MRLRGIWLALLLQVVMGSSLAAMVSPLEQAIAEYEQENYEEALVILQTLRASEEGDRLAYYLALTSLEMGKTAEALTYFEEAERLGMRSEPLYQGLAESALVLEDYVAAMKWLEEGERAGVSGGELLYLKGRVLAREKRYAEALETLELVKGLSDEKMVQVDYLKAQIYAAESRFDLASQALQSVVLGAPESDLAESAREYQRQFAQMSKEQRFWRGMLQLGYLLDSNAVAEPKDGLPGLPDAKDQALTSRLRLELPARPYGDWIFSARYSLDALTYQDNETGNQNIQSLSIAPGYRFNALTATLPVTYTYQVRAGEGYEEGYALTPTLSYSLQEHQLLQLSAGFSTRMMLFDYANAQTEELESREGERYSATLGYFYLYGQGRGILGARYEFSDEDTDGLHWNNRGHRLSLSAVIPLSQTLNFDLAGDLFFQEFTERNKIYDQDRSDASKMVSAGVSWEFVPQSRLFARYQYFRCDSNIFLYEYRRELTSFGVEFTF